MSTFTSIVRAGALAGVFLLIGPMAHAAPPTKEECIDAHSKGQDAREAGQLTQAGKLFLVCAQPACPDAVQNDCARFADEVERLQPTVTFVARDSAQNDLLDTSVYVDGTLSASRLGEGKAHDIDPGRHEVRFVHAGKEVVLNVVVNQGEKGRPLVGTFPSASSPSPPPAPGAPPAPQPATPEMKRSGVPLVFVGLGAAAAVAGGVIAGVGVAQVPASCSISSHKCAAPPKDPVFAKASSSVSMLNVGAIVGGAGVALLGGSLAWYFAQPLRPTKQTTAVIVPWVGAQGAGLSFSGSL